MEQVVIAFILGLFGLLFGSFAGATVWRLRARQLAADKAQGEPIEEKEFLQLKPLTEGTYTSKDRSRCLHCGHQLAWYDLIPLVSWVGLRGKCRYCRASIGWFEPLMEVATASFFVFSYLLWPEVIQGWEVLRFALWLLTGVGLVILFAYDQKWFLLPDVVTFPLIGLASGMALIQIAQTPNHLAAVWSVTGAVAILSGLYLLLWWVSRGRWVGFGDVKLGLVLALVLSDWVLAFVALFAANLIGCLVIIPGLVSKRLQRTSRVPFGPFLILGMVVAFFIGQPVIDWYTTLSFLPFMTL